METQSDKSGRYDRTFYKISDLTFPNADTSKYKGTILDLKTATRCSMYILTGSWTYFAFIFYQSTVKLQC